MFMQPPLSKRQGASAVYSVLKFSRISLVLPAINKMCLRKATASYLTLAAGYQSVATSRRLQRCLFKKDEKLIFDFPKALHCIALPCIAFAISMPALQSISSAMSAYGELLRLRRDPSGAVSLRFSGMSFKEYL